MGIKGDQGNLRHSLLVCLYWGSIKGQQIRTTLMTTIFQIKTRFQNIGAKIFSTTVHIFPLYFRETTRVFGAALSK